MGKRKQPETRAVDFFFKKKVSALNIWYVIKEQVSYEYVRRIILGILLGIKNTHAHACAQTETETETEAETDVRAPAHPHTRTHVRIRAHAHVRTHTRTLTHTRTKSYRNKYNI